MRGEFYRLYLRAYGRIVCRQEFAADSDGDAYQIAETLAEAASDACDAFEVWRGTHIVGVSDRLREGRAAVQDAVLEIGERIIEGSWDVARSSRLAARMAQWRRRPDASLLERVISGAVAAAGADTGNIQLVDDCGDLTIWAQHGHDREFLDFFAVVKGSVTSCGLARQRAERIIVEDVAANPIFAGTPSGAMLLRSGIHSTYSTPITIAGRVRGMLSTHRRTNWRPDGDELRRVDRFAEDAAAIIGP
jgi:GAF domain-containing protein